MKVRPFSALRPKRDVAAAVAAVPYDVVNTQEARDLAADTPLSFLHVTRAEIGLPPGRDPHDTSVYEAARANLTRIQRDAPLVIEAEASLYVYRLASGDHVQTGVAGCYSLDEYESGRIKKHERTRPDKEDDRSRHMVTLSAQTGVVFLTYRASSRVDSVVDRITETTPLFDFEAIDGVRHTVWRADPGDAVTLVAGFEAVPALYIADGHHRAASAARARQMLAAGAVEASPAERDFFLAVAFPDHETRILPYNRAFSDFGGASAEEYLAAVAGRLPMEATSVTMPEKGTVSMYVAGQWYRVVLDGEGRASESARPVSDVVASLDVSKLQEQVLGPLLRVNDIRTDPRVTFVGGARGTGELERLVDSGQAAVAFSLAAVTVDELLAISDMGDIMPPKSTWFEPKLRDGLLTHLL